MNRGQCFYDQLLYDQAIKDMETALKISATDPQVLYKLGLAYYSHKKFRRAIRTFKNSLKNKPFLTYESDIYYHIGLAYANLEKFEKSIYPFTQCIDMIPSDIRYIHERAKAFQMINEHDQAIKDFSTVIKKNPKNAHSYFRRAFSHKALKMYDEAAEDFEKCKSLDPLNPKLVVNYKKLSGIQCIVLCTPGEEKIFI